MLRYLSIIKELIFGGFFNYLRLGRYTNQWIVPRGIPKEEVNYVPSLTMGLHGLDLDLPGQFERLRSWREKGYSRYWRMLSEDPSINTANLGKSYIHNGYYPTPDAEIYAAMILDHKPKHIVEIGSGFSTLIARKIVDESKIDCVIEVIDPSPRTDVTPASNKVLLKYVEDVSLGEMNIGNNAIVFIDSSHICRGLGDIPHLFCKLIPQLPIGTKVHIHDIYIPFDYPAIYLKRLYTEQYVLYAMLSHNNYYRVLLTTHYISRTYPDEMKKTFGPIVGSDSRYSGASFWFEVVGDIPGST